MRPIALHPRAPDRPPGRAGVQQFAQDPSQESTAPWLLKEELRRLGFAAAPRRREGARARRPRAHGGSRCLRRRGHRRHRSRTADRTAPRRGDRAARRRHRRHRHRSAHQRRAGRGDRAPHRHRAASSSTTASAPSWTPKPSIPAIAFWASRYGKSTDGTDDYLNCPFDREQYERFVDELLAAQAASRRTSPRTTRRYFEACLPIEELARRGRDTLRFGPMKPVGLDRSAHRPAALGRGAAPPGKPARRRASTWWASRTT